MKTTVFLALAAAALASGTATAQSLGGSYQVQGTNFDGSPYGGTAQIQMTSETTCRIAWRTGGGNSVQNGICMRSGPVLSAAYVFSGGKPGLVIYAINGDGTLDGVWTIADSAGSGRERLVPAR